MTSPLHDRIGVGYADRRRADPRIQSHVEAALGSARTVLNVGAGTGSYEPRDRSVVAVEPSSVMIGQRRLVILTHDPDHHDFWLVRDYFPEIGPVDRARLPDLADVAEAMGGATMSEVWVPHDCTDGFLGAYWRRPRRYPPPSPGG